MILSRATKRNIVLFVSAFLLCGVLRAFLYRVDFAFAFSSLFCSVLVILWAITAQKRVTDRRLRLLMLWISIFLLVHFVLQILRYDVFDGEINTRRYLWYSMYIPMTAQPLLCFFIAMYIHQPEDEPLPRYYSLLIVTGALLVLGVLTNDLHFLAKSFPSGIMNDNGQEKSGLLYYLINVFIYGLYALAIVIIQKKNHRYIARRYRWVAVIPLLIGAAYFLLFPLDLYKLFCRTRVWNMGEMTGFCVIAALEACIQAGLVPANRGYETLFSAAELPAMILDAAGRPVYRTAAAPQPFLQSDTEKRVSHPITGGSIEYLVDIKQVQSLNQQLAERTQQIEARNAYIAEETRIKRERAEVENRNRLYDRISEIAKPQLEQIDRLLIKSDGCGEKELGRIAVLEAYIKRRSNMELLAAAGTLTVVELASAVAESLDYIRLCGVNTAASSVGTGAYPAEMVIAAYEHIEAIAEESLDTLSDMIVILRSAGRQLVVRMLLKAESFAYETNGRWQDGVSFSRKVAITKENQDMIIVLTFTEGGGRE